MKHLLRSLVLVLLLSVAVSSLSIPQAVEATHGGGFYLKSPKGGWWSRGGIYTVELRMNSAAHVVNAVQANMIYNPKAMRFAGVSIKGSPFNVTAEATYESRGVVRIARGSTGGLSGDQLVANVRFKALTGSGASKISFMSTSAIMRKSDNVNINVVRTRYLYVRYRIADSGNNDLDTVAVVSDESLGLGHAEGETYPGDDGLDHSQDDEGQVAGAATDGGQQPPQNFGAALNQSLALGGILIGVIVAGGAVWILKSRSHHKVAAAGATMPGVAPTVHQPMPVTPAVEAPVQAQPTATPAPQPAVAPTPQASAPTQITVTSAPSEPTTPPTQTPQA